MRRPLIPCLVAIVGVVALLAMHGVTGHGGLDLGAPHDSATAALMVLDLHHTDGGPGEGTDHHQDGPCDCPHGAAAMCALIVLAAIVTTRRTVLSSSVRTLQRGRPAVPTWSPDPPVPRSRLLLPAM
jgi:hypothetical protein